MNFQDRHGRTALMMFTYRGNFEMVKLLLAKGAEPAVQDRLGNTAVHYLAFSPKTSSKILKCFIERNFDFGIRNKLNVPA